MNVKAFSKVCEHIKILKLFRISHHFLFQAGVIVECGTHDSLMDKKGVYAELVKAQEIEKMEEKVEKEEDVYGKKFFIAYLNLSRCPNLSFRIVR